MSDAVPQELATGPYVGLEPLQAADRPYFKGREADQRVVIANLRTASLTILYGAAGVGKSSLLLAGVVPQLHQDFPKTPVVVFRDWSSPDYARRLARACIDATWGLGTDHPRPAEDRPVDEVLRACAEAARTTVLVLLDQFEDYLQYYPRSDAQDSFEAQFARAVNREEVDVGFLISVREASLSKLDRFRGRIPQLLTNSLRLKHLDMIGARQAIGTTVVHEWNRRHPAEPAMRVQKAVVMQVIGDAQADLARGELGAQGVARAEAVIEAPFLQLVMARLWKAERLAGSRVLRLSTLVDKDKLGGATQVVRSHLDEVMQGLNGRQKDVCATFFDRLVTPGGDKVPCNVGDLEAWAGAMKGDVVDALKQLSQGRILRTLPPDPRTPDQERYEIFHEVFAPSILDWHRSYHEEKARRRAVAQVQQRARIRGLVLAVVSLAALVLVTWGSAVLYNRKSSADRKAFQSMAVGASDPGRALALALEAADRIPFRMAGVDIPGITGPTPATENALRLAVQAARQEGSRRLQYKVMGVAVSKDGRQMVTREADEAAPARVTVWDIGSDGQASQRDSHSFPDDRYLQGRVAFVPKTDGSVDTVAAVIGRDVALWKFTDKTAPVQVLPLGLPINTALAVSADGSRVAAAGRELKDGVRRAIVKVWLTGRPGEPPLELDPGGAWIMGLAFSRNGCCLAAAAVERGSAQPTYAAVWSLASGRRILDLPMAQVSNALAFSPDGKSIVLGMRDNSVLLLRPEAGRLDLDGILDARAKGDDVGEVDWNDLVLVGHNETVRDVAFSDDSQRIASAGGDQNVIVWNARTGNDLFTLVGHGNWVEAVGFGPEGQRLVSVSRDRTMRFWNLASHEGSVNAIAFNPVAERAQFATGSSDRSARLWDRSGDVARLAGILRGHTGDVYRLAYSPRGDRIATASFDGTVKLWDTASGMPLRTFTGHSDGLRDLAFSADGSLLATASADGTARLYSVNGGSEALVTVSPGGKQVVFVLAVAFDPDPGPDPKRGQWATADWDGMIRLWDYQGKPRGSIAPHSTYPRQPRIVRLIFLPKRGEVAALIGGSVYFWPVARFQRDDGQAPRRLAVDDGRCRWMDLSRDEAQLAVGCDDGTVRVYDLNAGASEPAKTLALHRSAVNGVAFSPDGRLLGSASRDGTFQVAPLEFQGLYDLAVRQKQAMASRRE
ncbi:MAG: nSTAND1 domain-containing NTPase [Caldimonas sp.]